MAKVFDVQNELHEQPNRNNFDFTCKRHLSGKFGTIYPFFTAPTIPSDTWQIETAIGVNLMPMWYPTQSNMRFCVYFFYTPNRIMMKGWQNMLEGLTDDEIPYLDAPASFYRTGSLADYLGIPTNLVLSADTLFEYTNLPPRISQKGFTARTAYSTAVLTNPDVVGTPLNSLFDIRFPVEDSPNKIPQGKGSFGLLLTEPILPIANSLVRLQNEIGHVNTLFNFNILFFGTSDPVRVDEIQSIDVNVAKHFTYLGSLNFGTQFSSGITDINLTEEQIVRWNGFVSSKPQVIAMFTFSRVDGNTDALAIFGSDYPMPLTYTVPEGTNVEIADHELYNPYYHTGHTTNTVKVRSLAFRAYEMMYNSYFRDSHGVQPFIVDGVTKYNEYLPTDASGQDTTHYELHTRNWELDAYTSCLPSPQQGNAPIIGVSVDGTMRIAHDDGSTSTVRLRDLDGGAGVEVLNSNIDPEHPEDARTIMSLSSSGMTISDFRYGNALTRFLETSLRTGFRYADFIFGHFGMSPKHQELDMPIFLGGYTQLVDTSKVTNVAAPSSPDGAMLGQFAGVGASFDAMKHSIRHFSDDYGFIMGVMALVPDAAYSQVLPKHFTYNNRLDYFFPEFGQLGLQPITYEELCPIQSYAEYVNGQSSHLLTDTFGYQRPNHDLVWSPDTVHGLFRNALQGSVIQRRFGSRPVLNDDFMKIKPEECNDIFSVVESNDDTWLGQVVVKATVQRPIPRVVIPSLGR